jgi:ABC-type antimicrobial peptide transport system permease subunit
VTLFSIAKKNIKGNFKNYLVYFLSLLFCVVIYYTFVALQNNTDIQAAIESSRAMESAFLMASVVLLLFVVLFITYSNNFFAKKRKKEIGLYALLGMRKRTIGLMLLYENLLMGIAVLALGMLIGIFLSQAFATLFANLLDAAVEVSLAVSPQAVVMTSVVFLAVILYVSVRNARLIYRFKLIELFRAEREGERPPRASAWLSLLAVLLLAVGYWFALRPLTTSEAILTNLGVALVAIIIGTYLFFRLSSVYLLRYLRRRKHVYWRGINLIGISQLLYRIKGNARMLVVITLLSAVTLTAFSGGYSTYYASRESAESNAPFSYMFTDTNAAFTAKADDIITGDTEHSVREKTSIPVVRVAGETTNESILPDRYSSRDDRPIKVVSQSAYEQTTRLLGNAQTLTLNDQQAFGVRPMFTSHTAKDYVGESVTLRLPDGDQTLAFAGMEEQRIINWSFPDFMIVVSDSLFANISAQSQPITFVGYIVEGQRTTEHTAEQLESAAESGGVFVSTYYSVYRDSIESAGLNIFILGFLGFVFLAATGSILYFKQITEAISDRPRYEILRKIGVGKKQLRRSIAKQALFIFGVPLVVGVLHALVLIEALSRLLGNTGVSLAVPIWSSVGIYLLLYAFYFALTIRSSSKILLHRAS